MTARWYRNNDPQTPGFILREGGKQVGRILRDDFTRLYSCFVGEPAAEKWLGAKGEPAEAKTYVKTWYESLTKSD